MKFLCDRMLGTLAKWLRIYGFDTFYATNEMSDDELIKIAKKDDRILITRDKELTYVGRRENLKVIEINNTDIDSQLMQILKGLEINEDAILTRCLVCNSILSTIDKKKVKNKVPESAFQLNEEFWICKKCKKIYWRGSHYDDMVERINQKPLK